MKQRANAIAWWCLVLGLGGCKASDDWRAEVNVQLFRAVGIDLGAFSVAASQPGGKTGRIALEDKTVFADCRSNTIRILPKPSPAGAANPLRIELRVVAAALKKPVIKAFSLDDATAEKRGGRSIWRFSMMIGQGSAIAPAGCGASLLDAGTPADLDGDGGGGGKRTGEPCAEDGQCGGSKCLKAIIVGGKSTPMPNGYCSRECGNNPCPSGEKCVGSTNGKLEKIGAFCFEDCSVAAPCQRPSGYRCTTAGVCFPK